MMTRFVITVEVLLFSGTVTATGDRRHANGLRRLRRNGQHRQQ